VKLSVLFSVGLLTVPLLRQTIPGDQYSPGHDSLSYSVPRLISTLGGHPDNVIKTIDRVKYGLGVPPISPFPREVYYGSPSLWLQQD
jgi:hypothetical protein